MNLLENYAGTQCNYLLQRAQRSFKPLGTIHWNIFMSNVRYHVCSLSQLTTTALVENNGIMELRVYPLDNSSIHVLWSKVNQCIDVGKTLNLARLMTKPQYPARKMIHPHSCTEGTSWCQIWSSIHGYYEHNNSFRCRLAMMLFLTPCVISNLNGKIQLKRFSSILHAKGLFFSWFW